MRRLLYVVRAIAAALYGRVVDIMPLGWHHRPSNQRARTSFTGDYLRAAQDHYGYFLGTPQHRAEMFSRPETPSRLS